MHRVSLLRLGAAGAALSLLLLLLPACIRPAPIEGAACDLAHPCPFGYLCQAQACRRITGVVVVGCQADEDCQKGVCLEEAGLCVQCVADGDCPFSSCLEDANVCGCDDAADCLTGRCLVDLASCVSCYAHGQCASGVCDLDTGVCEPPGGS